MESKNHWERVYGSKAPTDVSWYQALPTRSLELLRAASAGPDARIIDIGGGDSTLVDAVLAERLGTMTVLDISGAALARAQRRLGTRAALVTWVEADVTTVDLPEGSIDIWHDRAVFHFMTESSERRRYAANASRSIRPDGTLVMATFALDGPARCSGLDVARYNPEGLAEELGEDFTLERGFGDVHRTPAGAEQRFSFAVMRRR